MDIVQEAVANMKQEIRRGTQVLAVLSLMDEPQYGYSLVQALSERGLEIEQNTLYPLLRRLEKQGLLVSDWDTLGSRPRRYYKISEEGREARKLLAEEWKQLTVLLSPLLEAIK